MAFTGYDESLMLLDGVENHRIYFFIQDLVMNSMPRIGSRGGTEYDDIRVVLTGCLSRYPEWSTKWFHWPDD